MILSCFVFLTAFPSHMNFVLSQPAHPPENREWLFTLFRISLTDRIPEPLQWPRGQTLFVRTHTWTPNNLIVLATINPSARPAVIVAAAALMT